MSFLQEKLVVPSGASRLPAVEFVTPKVRPSASTQISPTVNPWLDKYTKRKDITEDHKVDFLAIKRALEQDGDIRTAVNKYVNSIFLRGYKIHTLKPAIKDYLDIRLQMLVDAMPDHNHIDSFLHDVARDLVAYGNVYLVKIRRPARFKPQKIKIEGLPRLKPNGTTEAQDPLCAYELAHPAQMHIIRDAKGNVLRYEQWPWGERDRPTDKKRIVKWDADQVIHIVSDREDGFPYGAPFLDAVLDDIRLLRTIEDHVSKLAYRFAFPFTQLKVGEAKLGFEASEEDLDYYRKMIAAAPPDGTFVTSEKVSFDVVGAQGAALDLAPYLEHFENRVFTGLGVSGVAMGRGDTANRSTADAMSTEMHDQIKHFQNILAREITNEIFRELLMEGGYDLYADPKKNWAKMIFEEIEVESQIKREAHYLSLLQANAISFSEFRLLTGRQPFTQKEWDDTYITKFLIPQVIAKTTGALSIDEHAKIMREKHQAEMKLADAQHKQIKQDTENSKAEAEGKKAEAGAHQTVTVGTTMKRGADGSTTKGVTKTVKTPVTAPKGHFAGDQRGPAAAPKSTAKAIGNKNRPANQHGRRLAPKRKSEGVEESLSARGVDLKTKLTRYHAELTQLYADLRGAAIEQGQLFHQTQQEAEPKLVELLFALVSDRIHNLSKNYLNPAMLLGISQLHRDTGSTGGHVYLAEKNTLEEFNRKTIERLIKDVARPTLSIIKRTSDQALMEQKILEVFAKAKYRLDFIANTEVPQAFWFGYASAALAAGVELDWQYEEGTCEECQAQPHEFKNSNSPRRRLTLVPCLHPNCECGLVLRAEETDPEG